MCSFYFSFLLILTSHNFGSFYWYNNIYARVYVCVYTFGIYFIFPLNFTSTTIRHLNPKYFDCVNQKVDALEECDYNDISTLNFFLKKGNTVGIYTNALICFSFDVIITILHIEKSERYRFIEFNNRQSIIFNKYVKST